MRNVFYSVLNDIKFKEQYMECYKAHAEHIEAGISIICGLSSAWGIYAWTRWANRQTLWILILALAQVAQIVKSNLPYARRLNALKYLIPDMHALVTEVENKWYELESQTDPDYIPIIHDFRTRYHALDAKYLGADSLPMITRLWNKAEASTKNHLDLYIGIMEGGEPHE